MYQVGDVDEILCTHPLVTALLDMSGYLPCNENIWDVGSLNYFRWQRVDRCHRESSLHELQGFVACLGAAYEAKSK